MLNKASENVSDPSQAAIAISTTSVVAAGSFTLYCASLVTTLVFPVDSQTEIGPTLTVLPALCGLAAFALLQLAALRAKASSSSKQSELVALAVGCALSIPLHVAMASACFGLQASLSLQAVAWALWGIGQAVLFPLIGTAQSRADRALESRKATPLHVGVAMSCSSILFALALFAPDPLRSFLPAVYLFASCALLLIARSQIHSEDIAGGTSAFETLTPKILSPIAIGGTFGIQTCYCITYFGMQNTLGIYTAGCLFGGAAFLSTVLLIRRTFTNALIERFYFPVVAACFFLAVTLPDPCKIAPACIAAGLFFAYVCFHWSLVIAVAVDQGTVTAHHFSVSLFAPSAGLCLGWGVASVYALAGGDLAQPALLFFGWIVAHMVVLSVAPYASNTLLEFDLLNPIETPSAQAAPDRSGNSWEQACDRLATEAKLSPREREVFGMLAHGRNVKFIKENLFISDNTAKTHKYRIYRKLGVNTHQELLDRIEEFEFELLVKKSSD